MSNEQPRARDAWSTSLTSGNDSEPQPPIEQHHTHRLGCCPRWRCRGAPIGVFNLFFDQLFVKEPGSEQQRTPWHQDIPYWPFLGRQIASVWVSATDLTVEESSLEFLRGSHRWDKYFTPKAFTASGSKWAEANAGDELPDIEAAGPPVPLQSAFIQIGRASCRERV